MLDPTARNLSFRRRRIIASILLAALPLLPYSNCSSSHDYSDGSSNGINTAAILSNLRNQKNFILSTRCADCHNATTTDNALRDILNTEYLADEGYINPGAPQTSPLYLGIIDGIMPPQGSPGVSEYELNILRDWIAAEGGNFDTYIGGTPIDDGAQGEFAQVRQILMQHCTNCHRSGGDAPRLDVDAATLRGTVYLGRNLVVPNNANGSLLMQSLTGMPSGEPLGLNSPEANVIRNWINSGAR